MKLSKHININPIEYASQGNAILGIRDSGKSYTATWLAEQLMESDIPIIAFDPIGVWRNLKIGKQGKGYPVVVAGDNADLPLSPESAQNIVRAAMKENVSLVIDLYSMALSKADWKKIVEQSIRLLLYENKNCGLRHIFIEEAAEFCPQRVGPDQGRVYAEVEKLARMGGNASLGYTLINQRAEEVNKAVLELCDCLFLHRQKGRHSLTALGKWLDVADTSNSKEIINSLPSLVQGECWVWQQGSHNPERVKVPEKKTVHPDRRNPLSVTRGVPADVSMFVTRMKKSLVIAEPERFDKTHKKTPLTPKPAMQNGTEVAELKSQVESLKQQLSVEKAQLSAIEKKLKAVRTLLAPQYEQMKKIFSTADIPEGNSGDNGKWEIWLQKLTGKNRDMLRVLIDRKRITRSQLGLLVGMSANSGSFNTYLSKIKSLCLVKKDGNEFVLQEMS